MASMKGATGKLCQRSTLADACELAVGGEQKAGCAQQQNYLRVLSVHSSTQQGHWHLVNVVLSPVGRLLSAIGAAWGTRETQSVGSQQQQQQ